MSNVSSAVNYFPTANEGFITTIAAPGIASGASTVPLASISGLTNGTTFVGIVEPGLTNQQTFTGIVDTAGTQITGVVWTRGTNVAHATGTTIVDYVTGTAINLITTGIRKEHTSGGVHTLTSASTLTSSKVITSLNDTNGNELFKVTPTASAVNEFTVANAATGNGPTLSVTGGDTNIDANFAPKGTGQHKGIVDHLYNPYKFSVYRNAASTPAGSAVLACDTKEYDTGTNVDVVTNKGRFTVPVTGFYFFSAQARFTATAINQNFGVGLAKNGSIVKNGARYVNMFSGATSINAVTVNGMLSLTAGDYVEAYTLSDGTEALAVAAGALDNYFQGYLVSTT